MSLSICAVIAVRNEYYYLSILLPLLSAQRIDVVIIDNGSTDKSHELYDKYRGDPIISVEDLPYKGFFSLTEQLQKKSEIYSQVNHDWLIHQDADEILEHCKPGLSLRDAIQEANDAGYNALNFEEMTFLPESGKSYEGKNYYKELLRYYFFEKHKNFLNRAWKRSSGLCNDQVGGHLLRGAEVKLYPLNHVLRHYIVLSEEHAQDKYSTRLFEESELKKGWHKDRVNTNRQALMLPVVADLLFFLDHYESKQYQRSKPALDHYWHWN